MLITLHTRFFLFSYDFPPLIAQVILTFIASGTCCVAKELDRAASRSIIMSTQHGAGDILASMWLRVSRKQRRRGTEFERVNAFIARKAGASAASSFSQQESF